ncbi:MAG: hypothetical protein H6727_05845 [Myxococcales bacterium]|nr:hypothetical protein [Myxococcales bacterium]
MCFFGKQSHQRRASARIWLVLVWLGLLVACSVPPTEENCRNADACQQKGLCGVSADGSQCIATKKEDCEKSRFCVSLGECSLDATLGRCVAKTDDECRSSTQCKLARKCLAANGACVEINTEYCRLVNPSCETDGKCSLDTKNNVCAATAATDCAFSTGCEDEGRCSLDEQTRSCFVSTDSDCQRSKLCEEEGRCNADGPTSNRQCVPKTELDCRSSTNCEIQDKLECAFDPVQKKCITGDSFCLQSEACRKEGACSWINRTCIPGKQEDCQGSDACTREGRCQLVARACVRASDNRCADYPVCRKYGECTFDADSSSCIVTSDADCAQSLECWIYGRCSAVTVQVTENGTAKTRKFCRFTSCIEPCRRYGRCHLSTREGIRLCTAKTDADCTASEACQVYGMCKYSNERCIFDSDCKTPCTKAGNCTKGRRINNESNELPEDGCIATAEEGCVKSEYCQAYGMCSFDQRNSRCASTSCSGTPCGTYGRCYVENDQGLQRCGAHEDRDCLQSAKCTSEGLCQRSGVICIASDAGCAASTLCKERGRCHADPLTGKCTAKDRTDCSADPCKVYGRCEVAYDSTEKIFRCIADKADDCIASSRCSSDVFCTLREKDCVKSTDCSVLCTRYGQCERTDDGKGSFTCKITKTEHCKGSQLCTLYGQCQLEGDRCVAEPSDCVKSALCLRYGKCDFDPMTKSCTFTDRCANSPSTSCSVCAQTVACSQSGLCNDNKDSSTKDTQPCVAGEIKNSQGMVVSTTCLTSSGCLEKGFCAFNATKLICEFAKCDGPPCDTYGNCTAQTTTYLGESTNLCTATSEDNCQNSSNCAAKGNCHLKDSACIATTQKECDDSTECTNNGYCTLRNNACILASDENCQKSSLCRDEGACKFRASTCVVDSDADCINSNNCKTLGHCTRQPVKGLAGTQGPQRDISKCVAIDTNCASHQDTCKLYGRCTHEKAAEYPDPSDPTKKITPNYGTCAATPASCQSSENCKLYGQCAKDASQSPIVSPGLPPPAVGTGCISAPDSCKKENDPCKLYGRCKYAVIGNTRSCIASTDFECSESQICKDDGKCSKDTTTNECVAGSTTSCLQSTNCRVYGRCLLSNKTCVAGGATDCANSVGCASYGYCTFSTNTCVAASNTDCENSLKCKTFGYCTNLGSECYVQKDADCAKSADCTVRGFCKHVNGRCCKDATGTTCSAGPSSN